MLNKVGKMICVTILSLNTLAYANPDSFVIQGGDLRITDSGSGIVFPDGSIQYKATVEGPEGPQGPKGEPGPQGPPGPPAQLTLSAICDAIQSAKGSVPDFCYAAPIANAGSNETVAVGAIVTLDGSKSSATTGYTLSYNWVMHSKPYGSTATISNISATKPTFVPDLVGSYVLSLTVSDGKTNSSTTSVTILAKSPSVVSGNISTDTTWVIDNSPYTISDVLQIMPGVTLKIDPGVVVIGGNGSIRVGGNLMAVGTANSYIKFKNVAIDSGYSTSGKVELNYVDYDGGSPYSAVQGSNPSGYVTISNSILKNTGMRIQWNPTTCIFDKNIFVSSNMTTFNTGIMEFTNNAFIRTQFKFDYGTYNFKNNSFMTNDMINLEFAVYVLPTYINANNNYWNTIDTAIIDNMIYDKTDDLGCYGYVYYKPFLNNPDINTPDPTPYLN